MIDLEAIRYLVGKRSGEPGDCCDPCKHGEHGCWTTEALADEADALLAEVSRLNLILDSVRRTLRVACADLGDNEWLDNLHPSDVIEKHLARPARSEVERLSTLVHENVCRMGHEECGAKDA